MYKKERVRDVHTKPTEINNKCMIDGYEKHWCVTSQPNNNEYIQQNLNTFTLW